MRALPVLAAALLFPSCGTSPTHGAAMTNREDQIRATIQAFYQGFDEGFLKSADYATDDWYHINPNGGVDKGREATLNTVRAVHQTFLKGTTDTVKAIDLRFATNDVAVATVTSRMSPFTAPGGVQHGAEDHVRTFVVVNRAGRWRIMQDHNTTIVPPGPR